MVESQETATAKNLNEGRAQALQALLSSLSAENAGDPQNITSEQVDKISEKLEEILGNSNSGASQRRNERGDIINEEGLPIIEVSEPVNDASPSDEITLGYGIGEKEPIALSALSPAQRAQRRIERDRILALLETEEDEQTERDAENERQQRRSALERRKEAAKVEIARLKAAKEMQRRMGQALLRNMAEVREREERQGAAETEGPSLLAHTAEKTLKPKKSVSFAVPPNEVEEEKADTQREKSREWGDVSVAPLRGGARRALVSKADMDKLPMKMDVVERPLGGIVSEEPMPDSDDESVLGSPVESDADGEHDPIESELSDDEGEQLDDAADLGDDVDFSIAQHQREVALEYYRLRGTIGAEAAKAMTAHTHTEGEDKWDQPEVPLEATLSSKPPKPAMSQFKARRASAFNAPSLPASASASTSLGAAILPAEKSRTMQRAIRTGKLQDGKLIGEEDGENASDGEEGRRNEEEMIKMLQSGDFTNIGPTAEPLGRGLNMGTTSVSERSVPESHTMAPSKLQTTTLPGGSAEINVAPTVTSKPSRFKAARSLTPSTSQKPSPSVPHISMPSHAPLTSENSTPSIAVERSSPKLTPPRISSGNSYTTRDAPKQAKPPFQKPPTAISTPSIRSSGPPNPSSHTVSSPSLLPMGIIDSPSFPPSNIISTHSSSAPADSDGRTSHAQAVMSLDVRESQGPSRSTEEDTSTNARVSRFMAERY